MTPMTCRRCNTALTFLAYIEDRGTWIAFDPQPDDAAGHWLMIQRPYGDFHARDLSDDSAELQRARRDGIRLYVPHALRCSAVNR